MKDQGGGGGRIKRGKESLPRQALFVFSAGNVADAKFHPNLGVMSNEFALGSENSQTRPAYSVITKEVFTPVPSAGPPVTPQPLPCDGGLIRWG